MLKLEGVGKSYGPEGARTEVLTGVSLEIARGEFVAVIGLSGSGKTTLVSMIAGLVRPDAGRITLDGRPVEGPGPDRGLVFQNYSLLPWLSVLENVLLAVDHAFPSWTAERRREQARRNIALVGLGAAAGKRPAQLSGGMRQRVSVARALAMDPDILLLDEPLSALDALTRATLQGQIERLCEGGGPGGRKTVLLVTNDVDEAMLLADRIVVLGTGPGATLGEPIEVRVPRPRDRKTVHRELRYREARARVVESLRASARRAARPGRQAAAPVAAESLEVVA